MNLLMNPIVTTLIGLGICFVIWAFFRGRQSGKSKKQIATAGEAATEKKDIIPARKLKRSKYISLFFDTTTGRWFNKVVLTPEIVADIEKVWHSIGMEFAVFGAKEYMVNRYHTTDKDGVKTERYRPAQILLGTTGKTPTELYNVVMQQWVTPALPLTVKQSALQKLMPVLIWSGVLIFLGIMMVNS